MTQQQNIAEHWNSRQKAAKNDRELAAVMVDRARSVAKKAERAGDPRAWYALAEALHAWASDYEASPNSSSSSRRMAS